MDAAIVQEFTVENYLNYYRFSSVSAAKRWMKEQVKLNPNNEYYLYTNKEV